MSNIIPVIKIKVDSHSKTHNEIDSAVMPPHGDDKIYPSIEGGDLFPAIQSIVHDYHDTILIIADESCEVFEDVLNATSVFYKDVLPNDKNTIYLSRINNNPVVLLSKLVSILSAKPNMKIVVYTDLDSDKFFNDTFGSIFDICMNCIIKASGSSVSIDNDYINMSQAMKLFSPIYK